MKDNVSKFHGYITIETATDYIESDRSPFRRGTAICRCVFYEDSSKKMKGCITGKMVTRWLIYHNSIFYDNIEGVSDRYCNNQFTGTWKRYKGGLVKKCNWGDFRIPESKGLDQGAGEFMVTEKYMRNGWQSYWDVNEQSDPDTQTKALKKERNPWWK